MDFSGAVWLPVWSDQAGVVFRMQHGDLFQTHSAVIFRHPFSEKKTSKTPLKIADQVGRQDSLLQWAQTAPPSECHEDAIATTLDRNGNALIAGHSVTLIRDLVVTGGGFTAKRETLVKNIFLTSHPEHVGDEVNGTVIVLVAAFLKKAI